MDYNFGRAVSVGSVVGLPPGVIAIRLLPVVPKIVRFVAMGDALRPHPKAADAMKELGTIVETLSAAGTLLEKGLRR